MFWSWDMKLKLGVIMKQNGIFHHGMKQNGIFRHRSTQKELLIFITFERLTGEELDRILEARHCMFALKNLLT